jgi:hypothetical protein
VQRSEHVAAIDCGVNRHPLVDVYVEFLENVDDVASLVPRCGAEGFVADFRDFYLFCLRSRFVLHS